MTVADKFAFACVALGAVSVLIAFVIHATDEVGL